MGLQSSENRNRLPEVGRLNLAASPYKGDTMILSVLSGNQTYSLPVSPGDNLLEKLQEASLAPEAFCGGMGKCGKCRVTVGQEEVLACQYTIQSDITVRLTERSSHSILTFGNPQTVPFRPWNNGYMLACDIGTTTVAAYLLSPEGRELGSASILNPQIAYGADVVTRTRQALSGKAEAMTAAIRTGISELLTGLCQKAGITPEQIGLIAPVGNPCMQQLFMGIPLDNLSKIPFPPLLREGKTVCASSFFPQCPHASLLIIPDISGYIGADTIAGILASAMEQDEKTTLLVDIGTNGEMVLCHKGQLMACSTAAGPALEGACIKFGMRGASGAIDHVWEENGSLQFSVIGGSSVSPSGICGSGLIDAVAFMKKNHLVNQRGRIQSSRTIQGQRYFPLCSRIYLTQDDIRQIQLAKGAIAAGIRLMAKEFSLCLDDIDQVILAGAFGSYLNPRNACAIGLLPEELQGKITAAGNLAGTGAKLLAMDRELLKKAVRLTETTQFLELASLPDFQHVFAQSMML